MRREATQMPDTQPPHSTDSAQLNWLPVYRYRGGPALPSFLHSGIHFKVRVNTSIQKTVTLTCLDNWEISVLADCIMVSATPTLEWHFWSWERSWCTWSVNRMPFITWWKQRVSWRWAMAPHTLYTPLSWPPSSHRPRRSLELQPPTENPTSVHISLW